MFLYRSVSNSRLFRNQLFMNIGIHISMAIKCSFEENEIYLCFNQKVFMEINFFSMFFQFFMFQEQQN